MAGQSAARPPTQMQATQTLVLLSDSAMAATVPECELLRRSLARALRHRSDGVGDALLAERRRLHSELESALEGKAASAVLHGNWAEEQAAICFLTWRAIASHGVTKRRMQERSGTYHRFVRQKLAEASAALTLLCVLLWSQVR